LDTAITRAASYILRAVPNPTMGSVGGEWAVIGLARSRQHVSGAYFRRYFNAVERHVRERGGVLHERRITEYSRVILGLVAAGFDPRDVAGFNLMLPLGDFERTIWQGINGAIFALLALDSQNFDVPVNPDATVQATREMYVNEILRRQTPDGGWNLTAGMNGPVGANEKGDPDVTGMALQALAKYQDNPEVSAAIGRALDFLSGIQNADGGFTGNFSGGESVLESAVQVLVALTELGIPVDDPRFVKNGNTLVDNVISFQNPNGSFRHSYGSTESNLMSTEIGLYGLVAAQRAAQGRNSLYRMCDARRRDLLTP
ncbi:MAG: terpene cyclase/mutase family protein, partial [Defluviitaleaceae bacterium]|nr:terpene cyclase/mutase family protein [Defluviitaleaceae bacterium]